MSETEKQLRPAMTESKVDQIRRAWQAARPKDSNPAWCNAHHDIGVLLDEVDRIQSSTVELIAAYDDHQDALRAYDVAERVYGESSNKPPMCEARGRAMKAAKRLRAALAACTPAKSEGR